MECRWIGMFSMKTVPAIYDVLAAAPRQWHVALAALQLRCFADYLQGVAAMPFMGTSYVAARDVWPHAHAVTHSRAPVIIEAGAGGWAVVSRGRTCAVSRDLVLVLNRWVRMLPRDGKVRTPQGASFDLGPLVQAAREGWR